MDLERALVSKIIFTGQVEQALSRSISPEHFADDECRDIYEYIVRYTRKYKSAPSLEAAKHDRPDFDWLQIQDTLDWLIDRFTILVKRRMANDLLVEIAQAADDPDRSENIDLEFLEASQRLIMAVPSGRVERFSDVDKRIKEYERRKASGEKLGIPYGFPTLDKATGGILPHELVSVLGFTNIGKSTLLRVMAFNMWLKGYTPLYFSLEMEAETILHTFDAMAAELDFAKLKQLDLDEQSMKNWHGLAKSIRKRTCDIPIIDSLYRITPEQVYAETLRHKPDVVIVDYVGLMRSSWASRGSKRHQQLTEITQDLKINARMLRIPIIMAAQTNRGGQKDGAELENVADSISIAQDSDTVIGLFQDDEMEERREMELRVNKSRTGPRPKFRCRWDHENQIYRERNTQDLFKRFDSDEEVELPNDGAKQGADKWLKNQIQPFARR
jgi:replicative DNA helicase